MRHASPSTIATATFFGRIEGFEKAVKLRPDAWRARRRYGNRQSHVGSADSRRCRAPRRALLQTRIGRPRGYRARPHRPPRPGAQRVARGKLRSSQGNKRLATDPKQLLWKSGSQRSLPMRIRQKIREMLRRQLIGDRSVTLTLKTYFDDFQFEAPVTTRDGVQQGLEPERRGLLAIS